MISSKNNNKNPTLLYDSTVASEATISEDFWGNIGGGLRNYLALLNSNPNQYLNSNGESVLQVQFSGTPVSYLDMLAIADYAGIGEVKKQNNSGDFVGNVLGMNGNIIN